MENSLATRTFDRATAALRRDAVACLPEIVRLMRTLSRRSGDVSVPELAEVIQKDAVILAKVIGAANTLGYNPAAVPVTTVTQAIHVIGYERIRSLAMSLLLVEQTNRSRNVDEQREVAALALTAGCIAQAAAASRSLLNAEEAFVCASLRNFGRIVMVTCMADEYHEAQDLASQVTSDDAFRQIFGLTPLELGQRLLEASDLPEDILNALRAVTPDFLAAAQLTPTTQMLALTDFAAQLAEIALAPQLTSTSFHQKSRALAERYQHLLPHIADETLPLLETSARQLTQFAHTLRVKCVPPATLARLRQRSAKNLSTASPVADDATPAPPKPPISTLPNIPQVEPSFSWPEETSRAAALAATPHITRETRFQTAVEIIVRGLNASDLLLFCRSAIDDTFALTFGQGDAFADLQKRTPRIRRDERTVFGICLTRGENVLIHRAADPKLAPYLPAWLPHASVLGSFVLFPVIQDGDLQGLLLAGWSSPRQISLLPEEVRHLRALLNTTLRPREPAPA